VETVNKLNELYASFLFKQTTALEMHTPLKYIEVLDNSLMILFKEFLPSMS